MIWPPFDRNVAVIRELEQRQILSRNQAVSQQTIHNEVMEHLPIVTAWLVQHDLWERVEVRFDVVAVTGDAPPQWLRDAFEASS